MAANKEKYLELLSIAGAESIRYDWPLTMGRGNMRGAEDEHDQSIEIVESIRWVCRDHPEVKQAMGKLLDSYQRDSWDSMSGIVETYNAAVRNVLGNEKSKATANKRLHDRPSRSMLKHILQQVYNTAISDPNCLNHYEPFTPEVYGETSFELINQMIDQISPITHENKFLDLGSGVGQVVLQMAALTECQICVGIEKATIPAGLAVDMDILFKRWMAWYGKKYSPYKLYQGDFLTPDHRKSISESTIVFVNNYAFGPEVDHMLKERFADLKDGARIVSSKPFCPLNFRITERNLSDIGTIMHVSVMDPLKGSVSWTDKPVSYYLHIIDSTKLERYFNRQQNQHSTRSRRSGHHLLDADSNSNGSFSRDSRASSVEKDADSPLTHPSTNSGDDSDVGARSGLRGSRNRGQSNKKRFTKKKSTPRPETRVNKVGEGLSNLEVKGEETTPDTSGPASRDKSPNSAGDDETSSKRGSGADSGSSSSRPVRTAVVNAAAISEAQNDIMSSLGRRTCKIRGRGKYKHLNEGDRLPRVLKQASAGKKKKKLIRKKTSGSGQGDGLTSKLSMASVHSELGDLHQESLNQIKFCHETDTLGQGCMDDKLNVAAPGKLAHEELPLHLYSGGERIPHGLYKLLDNMKKQYMEMIHRMQTKEYKESLQEEITKERDKRERLTTRIAQLENQIDTLIQDSLSLLKARIRELGISASSPKELMEKASGIVCSHNDLQKKQSSLEQEVRKLEQEQENLIRAKEKELLDKLLAQKVGHSDLNVTDLKQMVQKEIYSCLELKKSLPQLPPPQQPSPSMQQSRRRVSGDGHPGGPQRHTLRHPSGEGLPHPRHMLEAEAGLPKLSSEVTLTKVGAPERLPPDHGSHSQPGGQHGPVGMPRADVKLTIEPHQVGPGRSDGVPPHGSDLSPYGRPTSRGSQPPSGVELHRQSGRDGDLGLLDRSRPVTAPRANDDYEDRVKMIITTELAKEKDTNGSMGGSRASISPVRGRGSHMMRPPGSGHLSESSRAGGPSVGHPPTSMASGHMDPRGGPGRGPSHLSHPTHPLDHQAQSHPRAHLDSRVNGHHPHQLPPDAHLHNQQGPGGSRHPMGAADLRMADHGGPQRNGMPPTTQHSMPPGQPGDPRGKGPNPYPDPRGGSRLPMDSRYPPHDQSRPPYHQDPRALQDPRMIPGGRGGMDPMINNMGAPPPPPTAAHQQQLTNRQQLTSPQQLAVDTARAQQQQHGGGGRQQLTSPQQLAVDTARVQQMNSRQQLTSPQLDGGRSQDSQGGSRPQSTGGSRPSSRADSRASNPDLSNLRLEGRGGKSFVDHMNQEIERSLKAFHQSDTSKGFSSSQPDSSSRRYYDTKPRDGRSSGGEPSNIISSQMVIDMSVERSLQSVASSGSGPSYANQNPASRLNNIIEESVRKDSDKANQRFSTTGKSSDSMEGLALPRGSAPPNNVERKSGYGGAGLPQVEGLAARFDSYFEKEKREREANALAASGGSNQHAGGTKGPGHVNSISSSSGPKMDSEMGGDQSKKRGASSPLRSPPGLPNKKASAVGMLDDGDDDGSDSRREPDDTRRWQDEISLGFDRLVAMASKVDKRGKSAENSPARQNSPRKEVSQPQGAPTDLRILQDSNPYDQQTLAMKFKAGLMGGGGDGGRPHHPPAPSGGSVTGQSSGGLPGENLPEHHFKKKYFNQEYQRQQANLQHGDPHHPSHRQAWEQQEHRNLIDRQRYPQQHQQRAYYEAASSRGPPGPHPQYSSSSGGGNMIPAHGGAPPPSTSGGHMPSHSSGGTISVGSIPSSSVASVVSVAASSAALPPQSSMPPSGITVHAGPPPPPPGVGMPPRPQGPPIRASLYHHQGGVAGGPPGGMQMQHGQPPTAGPGYHHPGGHVVAPPPPGGPGPAPSSMPHPPPPPGSAGVPGSSVGLTHGYPSQPQPHPNFNQQQYMAMYRHQMMQQQYSNQHPQPPK